MRKISVTSLHNPSSPPPCYRIKPQHSASKQATKSIPATHSPHYHHSQDNDNPIHPPPSTPRPKPPLNRTNPTRTNPQNNTHGPKILHRLLPLHPHNLHLPPRPLLPHHTQRQMQLQHLLQNPRLGIHPFPLRLHPQSIQRAAPDRLHIRERKSAPLVL